MHSILCQSTEELWSIFDDDSRRITERSWHTDKLKSSNNVGIFDPIYAIKTPHEEFSHSVRTHETLAVEGQNLMCLQAGLTKWEVDASCF